MSLTTPIYMTTDHLLISPGESESAYKKRLENLLINDAEHKSAREIVKSLFKIDPGYIQVYYSKKGLQPWEAGCTWYDTDAEVQLRPVFEKNDKYLGIYSKDEVLSHEYVHAVRKDLDSEMFEEIFAYLTSYYSSKNPLVLVRSFLGPLFSKPHESLLLVVLLMLVVISALTTTFFFYVLVATFFVLCFFFFRLLYRWIIWYKAYRRVGLAMLFRMTDEEIIELAKCGLDNVDDWLNQKKAIDFRWRELYKFYKSR